MRRNLLAWLVSVGLVTSFGLSTAAAQGGAPSSAKAPNGSLKDRFIGTWKLVGTEQRNTRGEIVPPAASPSGNPNRTGYIIYDPTGYVAVAITPVGRAKYAGPQPTDQEAQAALTGYASYFGTFTINEAEGAVTHHLQGSLNPGMAPDQKRFFELSGNRLILKPPPAANGNQARIAWERVPDVRLTAEHRKFVGFWKWVSNERRDERGQLVPPASTPGQVGYIIYTPAGVMMVHTMQPGRKPYAGAQPTPEEARETLRTYTNYFGPFYIHEADGYVVHDQVGTLNVGRNGPAPQQRFYQFVGRRLLLHPPATYTPDGHMIQGTITWELADGDRATR